MGVAGRSRRGARAFGRPLVIGVFLLLAAAARAFAPQRRSFAAASRTELSVVTSVRTWFDRAKTWRRLPVSTDFQQQQQATQTGQPQQQEQGRKRSRKIFFKRQPRNKTEPSNGRQEKSITKDGLDLAKDSPDYSVEALGNSSLQNLLVDEQGTITNSSSSKSDNTSNDYGDATTWATLLSESKADVSASRISALDSAKRQELQYGFFAPSNLIKKTAAVAPQVPSIAYAELANNIEYYTALANNISSTLQNTTSNAWKVYSPSLPAVPLPAILPDPFVSNLQPNDTITVAQLQEVLRANGYIRQQDLAAGFPPLPGIADGGKVGTKGYKSASADARAAFDQAASTSKTEAYGTSKTTNVGVAIPQPSVLDYKTLRRGTAVSGATIGMIVATTIWPNLWLMGLLAGGLYGRDLCSRPDEPPPSNLLARTLIACGRRLSKAVLQFIDYGKTLWFLYKTGELSYQYWRRYEVVDQRFGIQNKMDAWNARFQEGKKNFDAWEQENEIGRTILAGMRTVWLVDERSKRRAKQSSRYRLVQSIYDSKYWIGRSFKRALAFTKSSDLAASCRELLTGIKTDLSGSSGWTTRVGAVVASLFSVSLVGALYTLSPTFLAVVAVGLGVAWPSWVSELIGRLDGLAQEIRARGRGEDDPGLLSASSLPGTGKINTVRLLGRYDKTRYSYFQRSDGSRRYYRTGQSLFGGRRKDPREVAKAKKSAPDNLWPWSKPQKVRRINPGREQWGIFGSGPNR